jgi:hypothetical protein
LRFKNFFDFLAVKDFLIQFQICRRRRYMKKKLLLTGIILGVFFISSCDNLQDIPKDPLGSLNFTAAQLKAGAATAGVTAGSLSAAGGSAPLAYSLAAGDGDGDNGFFGMEGTALIIRAESLDEGSYYFRARAEDGEGQSVENTFTLKIGPPDGSGETEDPDGPDLPDLPGGSDNPNQGGGTDNPGDPDDPDLPGTPGSDNPGGGGGSDNPGGPALAKPARVDNLASKLGMRTIYLSWDAAARASSYAVYYSRTNNFAVATKFATEPGEPAATVTGLADSTVYNFWVVAKNSGGSATESLMHTARRTSDPVPEYLLAGMALANGATAYFKASNYGDAYALQDLGETYPVSERYRFTYRGINDMYPGDLIAFVRCIAAPDTQSYSGVNEKGCIIYRYIKDGQEKFHATYYYEAHLDTPREDYLGYWSTPPAAVMAQANGVDSGWNADPTDTLQEAIDKFAHQAGFGGYQSPMRMYYGYYPDYVPK